MMTDDHEEKRITPFVLRGAIVRLGNGYMATGVMGGVQFRANRKPTAVEALRDIFMQLTQGVNMEAEMALDLGASGEDYDALGKQMKAALEAGDVPPDLEPF